MTDIENHHCASHFQPEIDSHENGKPTLSATISPDGVEVYGYCKLCRDELTLEYEYVDWIDR